MLRTRLQVVQFNDSKYHTSEQSSTFHIDAILVIKGGGGVVVFFFFSPWEEELFIKIKENEKKKGKK